MTARDYAAILHRVESDIPPSADRETRMRLLVDILWDALHTAAVSWAGFYLPDPSEPQHLILGPRRDKPACSPIGLHGACGKSFLTREPLIVHDVAALGPNYIACDPKDRSELVLPCLEPDGAAWGVLDLDSYDVGAFNEHDGRELTRILHVAGLTTPPKNASGEPRRPAAAH